MEKLSRFDKCRIVLESGITCNINTGIIYDINNEIIGAKNEKGYIQILFRYNNKQFKLRAHQFIWFCKYGEYDKELNIDHINGIKDDNRIENLRLTTHSENMQNTKRKGYYFDKRSKSWYSRIQVNKKVIPLGYFKNEYDARQAYLNAKLIYHIN